MYMLLFKYISQDIKYLEKNNSYLLNYLLFIKNKNGE